MIDDTDFDLVKQFSWHVAPTNGLIYATASATRQGKRVTIYMHRLVMGASVGTEVDHKDRNGLHNWQDNLRVTTHSHNLANAGMFSSNTSGYKGVIHYRNGWRAQTKLNGRLISSCTYPVAILAAEVRDALMIYLHGHPVYLNLGPGGVGQGALLEAKRLVERTERSWKQKGYI